MAEVSVAVCDEIYNLAIGQLRPICQDIENGEVRFAGQAVAPEAAQVNLGKVAANAALNQLKALLNSTQAYSVAG